jgi:hypothetical protein
MASSEKKVRGTGVAASAPLAVVSSVAFGLPLMSASSSSATGDSGSISRLAGADDSALEVAHHRIFLWQFVSAMERSAGSE